MQEYKDKIVFIGGGVTAMATAVHLIDNGIDGKDIIIIEKGNDLQNRKIGDLLSGSGGSGVLTDSKLVFSYFEDKPLQKHLGLDKFKELSEKYIEQVYRFHPDTSKIHVTEPGDGSESFLQESNVKACTNRKADWENEFILKESKLVHLGSHYGKLTNFNAEQYLKTCGVNYRVMTEAIDVDFENKIIHTKALGVMAEFDEREVHYDKLIISTGKASKKFVNKILNKEGIYPKSTELNMGVRLELPWSDDIAEIVEYAYDYKFEKRYDNNGDPLSLRTFCTNNLSAFLETECYQLNGRDSKSINGHALGIGPEFEDRYTYTSNTALMCQKFLTNENDVDIVDNIMKKIDDKLFKYESENCTFKTAYSDYEDTWDINKEELVDLYGELGNNIFDFIEELRKILKFKEFRFFGPEYKLSSGNIYPNLKENSMELKELPGVFVGGDLTSAIGIVPSAVAGIKIAEEILGV